MAPPLNLQIINLVNDSTIVHIEMLEDYFLETVYPLCIQKYQTKQEQINTTEDGGPVITTLAMQGLYMYY